MVKACEFRHEGKVLVVRVINQDGTSYHGFKNPTETGAIVEAPDWNDREECGGGIHGWPWGLGREGKEYSGNKIWQVLEPVNPDEVVSLEGKAKWRALKVLYSGTQAEAMKQTMLGRIAYIFSNSEKATSGNRSSAATSGYGSSAATSGDWSSAATSGNRSSAATSGNRSSAATSGDWSSAATSGNRSSAATSGDWSSAECIGSSSVATCVGVGGKARTKSGVIVLGYESNGEHKFAVGHVPEQLKSDTWYRVTNEGQFEECEKC